MTTSDQVLLIGGAIAIYMLWHKNTSQTAAQAVPQIPYATGQMVPSTYQQTIIGGSTPVL